MTTDKGTMMFSKNKLVTSKLALLLMGAMICLGSGCSMCCGVYDYNYPTFGGKHERMDPAYGRVGSVLSDPMADPGVPAITNTQLPPEQRQNDFDMDEYDDELDGDAAPVTNAGSGNRNSTQPVNSGAWR